MTDIRSLSDSVDLTLIRAGRDYAPSLGSAPASADDLRDISALMAARGVVTKSDYLAFRDALRDLLRVAGEVQRAHRRAEIALKAGGGADAHARRERVYEARMRNRWAITKALDMRRAGKIWAGAARAAETAAAA